MTFYHDGPVTSVKNILEAFSIYHAARELVDGQVGWCDSRVWTDPDEETKSATLANFAQEPLLRANCMLLREARLSAVTSGLLHFAAMLLHFSRNVSANKPKKTSLTKQHLATGKHYASWIWGAEDHMGSFCEMGSSFDPYYKKECMHDLVFC